MADAFTPPFVMHGARDSIAAGLAHIEEQVAAIEQAVVENPALAFDLARTLVESVCRTILTQRKFAYRETDDLPKLFKTACNQLPFLPSTASGDAEARESLSRTLSGLSTAIQGICELRNRCGFASHGSGNPRAAMESVQAFLAAGAADTIVGFLYRVHRQDRTPSPSQRTLYDENPGFNESVDELHSVVRIFNEEFVPSRVLFELAPEPYRLYLTDFDSEAKNRESDSGENGAAGTTS
jgi:hypothetical protein